MRLCLVGRRQDPVKAHRHQSRTQNPSARTSHSLQVGVRVRVLFPRTLGTHTNQPIHLAKVSTAMRIIGYLCDQHHHYSYVGASTIITIIIIE